MGLINSLFGNNYPEFDEDKVYCKDISCSRSMSDSPGVEEKGFMWICVSCLDIYCNEHNNWLYFYQPNFGISNVSAYNSMRDIFKGHSTEVNNKMEDIVKENLSIWEEEMNKRGYKPRQWGDTIEMSGYSRREGYIVCDSCMSGIEDAHESSKLHYPEKLKNVSKILKSHGSYSIPSNLLHSSTLENEDFAERFVEVYG